MFSVAVGALGLLAARAAGIGHADTRALTIALAAVTAAALLQAAPLPSALIQTLSPARDAVDFAALYAKSTMREVVEGTPARTLSIEPSRTWLGLAFLVALSMLLVGTTRGLGAARLSAIARGIVVLGVVAAFLQIFQRASASSVVYGLFEPRQPGAYSAPFVNRNHTAGWLVMALSLALGHLAGSVARGMRGVKPTWRDRLIWFSTPAASETILTAFAVGVMAIAIVTTQSRSGVLCLLLAVAILGWWSLRRQASRSRRLLASTHLLFVVVAAAVMGGADAVGRRFSAGDWDTLDGRLGIWQDALRIAADFPLTGTGLNTFGIAMLHYQTVEGDFLFIEAHNDYLHLLAEGGALLVLPALALVAVVIATIRRRFREGADDARAYWLRAGAVTGLLAIAFQSIFDFTLQMPGAAVMAVALAAVAMHGGRTTTARSRQA